MLVNFYIVFGMAVHKRVFPLEKKFSSTSININRVSLNKSNSFFLIGRN